jgi:hypothetical protein
MKTISSLVTFLLLAASCSAQIMGVGNRKVMHVASIVPSIVQSKSTGSSGSVTTLALTSPVTAGNVLVGVIYQGLGATLTFTDTQGSIATSLASVNLATDEDTLTIVCAPITSSGTDTLTFKANGSTGSVLATAYEVHNATCTQDVTAVSHNALASTSCNSGSMTTSTANDLLIGACGIDGTDTAAIMAGSGWTGALNAGNTGHPLLLSEYQIGTSPGSFTATSATIPSEEQGSLLVALKP